MLRERNIRIWVEEDRLLFSSPPDMMTPELLASLKKQKDQILLLLRTNEIEGSSDGPVCRTPRSHSLSLSFAQERLWFLSQMDPEDTSYNVPSALRLKGELKIDALQKSIDEIVQRHEVLRTAFAEQDGRPVQVIHAPKEMYIRLIDLTGRSLIDREAEAAAILTEESQRPFDLSSGPLLRAVLLRLDDHEHILLITIHHIVYDGWSGGILRRELSVLYEAFSEDKPSPLPELAIQYADFAMWQRQWLQGEVLEKQLSYWKEKLQGAPPVLELPLDRPRPAVQTYKGAVESFVLTGELLRA